MILYSGQIITIISITMSKKIKGLIKLGYKLIFHRSHNRMRLREQRQAYVFIPAYSTYNTSNSVYFKTELELLH